MKNAIRNLLSRPSLQPLFAQMLKVCHAGMNYGGGQTVEVSGELHALEFVSRSTGPLSTFTLFDVGANDGGYLGCALAVLGGRAKVHSFEPQSASFDALHKRFHEDPRVKLRKIALGRSPGTANLHFDAAGETTATLQQGAFATQEHSEEVSLSTVDEICREEKIERIHLLKIDTEGFEMEVLIGASEIIGRGAIDAIQFEFGDTFLRTPYHFVDFWELLSSKFVIYRILRRGLCKVERYSPDLEIFKLANFLCVRRP